MKIHTKLDTLALYDAARTTGVRFARLDKKKSRSHPYGYDVILSGSDSSQTQCRDVDANAATWDEWGIFLAEIFLADREAKATYYKDASDFHYRTGGRFKTLTRAGQHRRHKWQPGGGVDRQVCECGAVIRH
jgi:hypothetical protein